MLKPNNNAYMTNDKTIGEAREFLEQSMSDGVTCPCCTQFVKLYRRTITGNIAVGLMTLYKYAVENEQVGEYIDLNKVRNYARNNRRLPSVHLMFGGDFAKLVHWGMIEPLKSIREDGSDRVGFYKITDQGIFFLRGVAVPKYIYLYNAEFKGFDNSEILTIEEALGKKFNYRELMEN